MHPNDTILYLLGRPCGVGWVNKEVYVCTCACNMFVCTYVYTYICVYVSMYECTNRLYNMFVCMCVCTCECITSMHVRTYVSYVCLYVRTYVYHQRCAALLRDENRQRLGRARLAAEEGPPGPADSDGSQ